MARMVAVRLGEAVVEPCSYHCLAAETRLICDVGFSHGDVYAVVLYSITENGDAEVKSVVYNFDPNGVVTMTTLGKFTVQPATGYLTTKLFFVIVFRQSGVLFGGLKLDDFSVCGKFIHGIELIPVEFFHFGVVSSAMTKADGAGPGIIWPAEDTDHVEGW